MEKFLGKLADSAAGIVAAGIVSAIWLNMRWLFSSKRSIEKILSELSFMQSNITILFRLQGPLIMSLKATLEAQRDGKCNGNVDKAIEMIEEGKKEFDEHLLNTLAGQGENANRAGPRGAKGTGIHRSSWRQL